MPLDGAAGNEGRLWEWERVFTSAWRPGNGKPHGNKSAVLNAERVTRPVRWAVKGVKDGLKTDPGIDKAQTLAATKLTRDESPSFHGPARAGGRRPA